MASAIAKKYTDEIYATKQELGKSLNTSLCDPFWKDVIAYRNQFTKNISLSNLANASYKIVYTNSLTNELERIGRHIDKAIISKNKIDIAQDEEVESVYFMYEKALEEIGRVNNIETNSVAIKNIIQNRPVDSIYAPLINYKNALFELRKHYVNHINEDFFAKYLQILRNESELTSFYRTTELTKNVQSVINPTYNGAPVNMIENKMNELFDYISESSEPIISKVLATIYVITYIKPFEKYNNEMAIITAKAVLEQANDYADNGAIFPIELLVTEGLDAVKNYVKEIENSRDLTYAYVHMAPTFLKAVDMFSESIVESNANKVRTSYYEKEDVEEEQKVEETKVSIEPKKPSKVAVKKIISSEEKPIIANVRNDSDLDDRTLNKAMDELLEKEPELKKKQAHFYVRHCTPGHFYTIQQYKKSEGTVYETARTSMDDLARLGYYRKEQIKNKFVYTPLLKK